MNGLTIVALSALLLGCESGSNVYSNGECVVADADGKLTIVISDRSECTAARFHGVELPVVKLPAAASHPSIFSSRIGSRNGPHITYLTAEGVLLCGIIRNGNFTENWRYVVPPYWLVRSASTAADGRTVAAILDDGENSQVLLLGQDGVLETFSTGADDMPEQIRLVSRPDQQPFVLVAQNAGTVFAISIGSIKWRTQIDDSTLWPRLLYGDGDYVIHGDTEFSKNGSTDVRVYVGGIENDEYHTSWSVLTPAVTPQDGFLWQGDLVLHCLDKNRNSQILRIDGDCELTPAQTRNISRYFVPRGWMACDLGGSGDSLFVLRKKENEIVFDLCQLQNSTDK